MSKTPPLLAVSVLILLGLPTAGRAQVNPPQHFNPATGELVEQPYVDRYAYALRDRRREEQFQSEEYRDDRRQRELAYTADACGIGCDLHEGIQVRGIPGTFVSAALYKTRIDGDVLTVQLRFFNDGIIPTRLAIDPSSGSVFVQAGGQRAGILTDDDGEMESKESIDEMLDPGEVESWWARFPVPLGATTFDLHIPGVTFRDVPLETD